MHGVGVDMLLTAFVAAVAGLSTPAALASPLPNSLGFSAGVTMRPVWDAYSVAFGEVGTPTRVGFEYLQSLAQAAMVSNPRGLDVPSIEGLGLGFRPSVTLLDVPTLIILCLVPLSFMARVLGAPRFLGSGHILRRIFEAFLLHRTMGGIAVSFIAFGFLSHLY